MGINPHICAVSVKWLERSTNGLKDNCSTIELHADNLLSRVSIQLYQIALQLYQ